MTPEALTAGRAALDHSTPENYTVSIRTWIAGWVNDLELLPADLTSWEHYERAMAHELVGATDIAIDDWLAAMRMAYDSGIMSSLMQWLLKADLLCSANALAELVLQQSRDDFTGLLDVARTLSAVAPLSETTSQAEGSMFDRYLDRLVELGGQQFKTTIQTYELLRSGDHLDIAEEFLQRLTKQADSVSELIAVAVLRRRSAQTAQSRGEVLRCLRRAESAARDQSERLQIARELFHWGEPSQARALLERERIFDRGEPMSHADAAVTVQCARWLPEAEQADVVDQAVGRLLHDETLGRDARSYAERLIHEIVRAVGEKSPLAVAAATRLQELRDRGQESAWTGTPSEGMAAVERLRLQIDNHDVASAPFDLSSVVGPDTTLGLRITAVADLQEGLRASLDAARRVTIPAQRPVAAVGGRSDDGADWDDQRRSMQLRDLWRARLVPRPGADESARRATDVAFRAFFDEEQVLREIRQRRLREAAAPSYRQAMRYGLALKEALPQLLGAQERTDPHPVMRVLFSEIARDVTAQLADLDEVLADIEDELKPAEETGSEHDGRTE